MRYASVSPRDGFWHKLLIAVLCCMVLFIETAHMAFGITIQSTVGTANFSLQPLIDGPSTSAGAYFAISAAQGVSVQKQVRVTNTSSVAGTAILSPVDGETAQTSGVVYVSANQTQHDVGAWVTLAVSQVTLAPGKSQVVPFKIVIPKDGRPGEHLGGIAAQNAAAPQSTTGKGQFQINMVQRFVVPVLLTLPGSLSEGLTATGIQPSSGSGYQDMLVALSNTGDVELKPHGNLQVADAQGHMLRNLTMSLGTFLPQTSINYPVYIQNEALTIGTYQATLTLYYGHNHVLHYITTFVITVQQLQQITGHPLNVQPLPPSFWPSWAMTLLAVLTVLVLAGASGLFFWRLATRSAPNSKHTTQGRHRKS